MKRSNNQAFSLVELSLVIVIIGLLMAAITGGTHLLQAAKINKIVSEFGGYAEAVNNFKDKYESFPGDMANASSFWNVTDGDGNEQISGLTTEALYAWQEMALSGMIAGNYTGADAGTPDFSAGADGNVPESAVKGAYYFLYYYSSSTTSYDVFETEGNALMLGNSNTDSTPWGAVLTPSDAHIIDEKMDDGKAASGTVYAIVSGVSGGSNTSTVCVSRNYASAQSDNPAYILTDYTESCRLLYWLNKI